MPAGSGGWSCGTHKVFAANEVAVRSSSASKLGWIDLMKAIPEGKLGRKAGEAEAKVVIEENSLTESYNLGIENLNQPDHVHISSGVKVRTWSIDPL